MHVCVYVTVCALVFVKLVLVDLVDVIYAIRGRRLQRALKSIWLKGSECRARKLMAAGEPHLIFVESPLDASLIALPAIRIARESSTSSERSTRSREGTSVPSPIKGMVVQTQHLDGQGNARAADPGSSSSDTQLVVIELKTPHLSVF